MRALIRSSLLAAALGIVSLDTRSASFDYAAGQGPLDPAGRTEFAVVWPERVEAAADVSFLLAAPAGAAGQVGVRDGHLATADGLRLRLWGINVTGGGALPAKEHAARVAANLARLGFNAVRFHFLDRPAPRGLVVADRADTRALDPVQLDRLDWFVAELKRRGLYVNLNLNVARAYKAGDGVKDHELLGFAKAVTFFDPRLLELQREYARQLLSHRNPYTQSTYAQDPAVALVELVNENSLVEAWKDGRLQGRNTRKNPGTWTDIPASYAADLTTRFNAWLRAHHPDRLEAWREAAGRPAGAEIPRLSPDQFARAPADRFHAEVEFYLEIERTFFLSMAKFLREELGVRALLAGNSDHGHSRTGYPQLAGTALLDVVDSHVYWQHPKYLTDAATGRQTGFTIGNTPMVDDPRYSAVVELSRSAFAGKPFMVSEVNHPFPHEYACEGVPILAAYAALQDWDAIFWYTLAHSDAATWEPKIGGHFDLGLDPVKMAQFPAGALLFLRGDVRPAARTVARTYTREQVRESIRLPYAERPYFTPGFPRELPLRHGSRIASFDGPPTGKFEAEAAADLRADTGELLWQAGAPATGLVTIDTPRSQAVIGFAGGRSVALGDVTVEAQTPFCAITLGALDARPIAESSRLLVTATARTGNAGMAWNERRNSLAPWGAAPTWIEAVRATLRWRARPEATRVTVVPLDGAGRATGAPVPAARAGAEWVIELGAPTTSYLVTAEP